MDLSSFLYEVANGIATVRLNNPEKLNALTFQTYEELERLFADLAHDNQVKVVIITGSGKGFCSGGSVHEIIGKLIDMSADELHRFTRMSCNVTKHMRNLKADYCGGKWNRGWRRGDAGAGERFSVGVGSSKVCLSVRQGRLSGADMGALYLLPRLVGLAKATELLFLGDAIDAREAYRIGLANRGRTRKAWHEAHELAPVKAGTIERIGSHEGLVGTEANMDLESALNLEAAAQAGCMETADFKEGYRAFVEKRAPVFNRS